MIDEIDFEFLENIRGKPWFCSNQYLCLYGNGSITRGSDGSDWAKSGGKFRLFTSVSIMILCYIQGCSIDPTQEQLASKKINVLILHI